jgi:hypothetical protein
VGNTCVPPACIPEGDPCQTLALPRVASIQCCPGLGCCPLRGVTNDGTCCQSN